LQNVVSAKTDAWRLIEGLLFVATIVFLPGGLLGSFKRSRAKRILATSVRTGPATP
jgi:ABC-type branched-subunit amino acid transport system permease subunit